MKTRSQTKDVIIDFDEASKAWLQNKRRLPNGCYSYICGEPTKNGGNCSKKPVNGECRCYQHLSK